MLEPRDLCEQHSCELQLRVISIKGYDIITTIQMAVSTDPDQRHALVRGQLPATGVDQDTYNGRYVPSTRLDPILPMPATPSMFTFL